MSFYDDASLILLAGAAAGKDGKAYNVKPVPEYGPELVTNGDFATDSDWDKSSSWSIGGGIATYDKLSSGQELRQLMSSIAVGKTIEVKFDISNIEATKSAYFKLDCSGTPESIFAYTLFSEGTYTYRHTITGGFNRLTFTAINSGNGGAFSIDNISVKEVTNIADFDFSRGSNLSATRVGADGLIEKGRENLLLQSNSFSTSPWNTNLVTATSGQSGYNGNNNAWKIDLTGAAGNLAVGGLSVGSVGTYSVYAKAGTLNWIVLGSQSGNIQAYINISDGSIGTTGALIIEAKTEDVGGGWYRCSMTYSGTATVVRVYPAQANGNLTATSGNIYIQNAQLEIGLAVTEVIESGATTGKAGVLIDLPRIDYSSGAGALLLEPSRQQLLQFSEYATGWSTSNTGVTIEENATTSPEGVNNAAKIKEDGTNAAHAIRQLTGPTLTSGTDYTFSFFAKKGERSIVALSNTIGASNDANCFFDLENGQVLTNQFNSASIEDFGNGWYRCIATDTADAADDYDTRIYTATADNQFSHQGVSGSGLYIYGLQLEAGSYVSSYIPNHGTSGGVTRAADSCIKTDISSVLNASEGTLFTEMNSPDNSSISKVITIGNSTTNKIQLFYYEDSVRLNFQAGGVSQAYLQKSITTTDTIKVAVRYSANDVRLYVNGSLAASDTNATMPSALDYFRFDNGSGSAIFIGDIKQCIYFNSELTDAECITLTTL